MIRVISVVVLVILPLLARAGDPISVQAVDLGKKLATASSLNATTLKPFAAADDEIRKEFLLALPSKHFKISDENRVALNQFALKKDPNEEVRLAAVTALGKMIGYPPATKALVELLAEKSPALRKSACDGLYGYRGDPTLGVKLAKLLDDESLLVRQSAVRTLGKLGDRKQVPAIVAAYKKVKKDTDDDAPFCEALALLGETDVSLEIARVCMKSRKESARYAAVTAIECNPSATKTIPIIMENLILELNRTTKLDPSKKDWDVIYVTLCSELVKRSGQNHGVDAIGWYKWWDGVRAKYNAPAPAFEASLVSRWMETYRKMGPSKVKE